MITLLLLQYWKQILLAIILLALFVLFVKEFWRGFWRNHFNKKLEKWKEKREKKQQRKKEGYKKYIKYVLAHSDIEIVGKKGSGKTTQTNFLTFARNENKLKYIKKNKLYYSIMYPQLLEYIKEKETNGFLPFVASNFDIRCKKTALRNNTALPILTQQEPAIYGMFFALTEMRSFLSKSLHKKNTKELTSLNEVAEKSRHLDFYFTYDSLIKDDYYIGFRVNEPLTIYTKKAKYKASLNHNAEYALKRVLNLFKGALYGRYRHYIKKDSTTLKEHFKTIDKLKKELDYYKNIKIICFTGSVKWKFTVPYNKYFEFETKHFKKEYVKKFEKIA